MNELHDKDFKNLYFKYIKFRLKFREFRKKVKGMFSS